MKCKLWKIKTCPKHRTTVPGWATSGSVFPATPFTCASDIMLWRTSVGAYRCILYVNEGPVSESRHCWFRNLFMPNWTFICTSCLTDIQANFCAINYTVGSLCLPHTVVTGVSCCYFALLITAHLQKLAYLAAVLDKMQLASAIVFITLNSQAKIIVSYSVSCIHISTL